jgi:hypothetical protein
LLESECDPINYLNQTFISKSIAWFKASTLHVVSRHTNLLIIKVKRHILVDYHELWFNNHKNSDFYYLESSTTSSLDTSIVILIRVLDKKILNPKFSKKFLSNLKMLSLKVILVFVKAYQFMVIYGFQMELKNGN